MKRQRAVLCCIFFVLCGPRLTFAQNAAAQAHAAYQAKNWSEATTLYSDLAHANPAVARYWYRLGVAAQASGALKESVMDFWTDDIPQPDGTKLRRHLQFFNLGPDKVRQFSQGSKDGGKTWSVEYDFTYTKGE